MRLCRSCTLIGPIIAASLSCTAHASAEVRCGRYFPTTFGPAQICDAGIPSQYLDITAQLEPNVQLQSQWCWAAAISGVFAYYGHPVSQQEIVRAAYGDIVNMPGTPQAITASLNRPWVDDFGRRFGVSSDVYTANWVTAAQDLAQNLPLIVGSLGHAMIVSATEYRRFTNGASETRSVVVRDPWPTNPRRRTLTLREAYGVQVLIRIRVFDLP